MIFSLLTVAKNSFSFAGAAHRPGCSPLLARRPASRDAALDIAVVPGPGCPGFIETSPYGIEAHHLLAAGPVERRLVRLQGRLDRASTAAGYAGTRLSRGLPRSGGHRGLPSRGWDPGRDGRREDQAVGPDLQSARPGSERGMHADRRPGGN